jgi:hypothetical protein
MPHSGNSCQANIWTGIGNNVMDGVGLMEGLINLIKPLYFVVASITIKVRIPAKKTKYQQTPDILNISVGRGYMAEG